MRMKKHFLKKMLLQMMSTKYRPFCVGLRVYNLNNGIHNAILQIEWMHQGRPLGNDLNPKGAPSITPKRNNCVVAQYLWNGRQTISGNKCQQHIRTTKQNIGNQNSIIFCINDINESEQCMNIIFKLCLQLPICTVKVYDSILLYLRHLSVQTAEVYTQDNIRWPRMANKHRTQNFATDIFVV